MVYRRSPKPHSEVRFLHRPQVRRAGKSEVPRASRGGPVQTKIRLSAVFCLDWIPYQVRDDPRGSLLRFFVLRTLHAPIAKLQKLDFELNFFLVLFAPVIHAFAGRAGELDKAV